MNVWLSLGKRINETFKIDFCVNPATHLKDGISTD